MDNIYRIIVSPFRFETCVVMMNVGIDVFCERIVSEYLFMEVVIKPQVFVLDETVQLVLFDLGFVHKVVQFGRKYSG